ncbi:MAG TPA: hypothetical protein VK563_20985 [Puia sp.]|nr:hypothetical protein [Puia sp.]
MHFDKIINTVFSFASAVVIFGAWGKIEHKEFGDTALTAGLLCEVGIFCIYGLMEWRKKPASQEQAQSSSGGGMAPGNGVDMGELASTMKQTNRILNKVFRAD